MEPSNSDNCVRPTTSFLENYSSIHSRPQTSASNPLNRTPRPKSAIYRPNTSSNILGISRPQTSCSNILGISRPQTSNLIISKNKYNDITDNYLASELISNNGH